MFEEIKAKLLEQPESIIHILEAFECHKARINGREIRCAREEFSNPTAVVIRLTQNENLLVKDKKCRSRYKGVVLLGDFGCKDGAKGVYYPIEPTEKIIISNMKTESGKCFYLCTNPKLYKKVKVVEKKQTAKQ